MRAELLPSGLVENGKFIETVKIMIYQLLCLYRILRTTLHKVIQTKINLTTFFLIILRREKLHKKYRSKHGICTVYYS